MKFDDLRPCDACNGPIGLTFHRVVVQHHVVDPRQAQRRLGMEAFFGGNGALASVFDSAGDDATKPVDTVTVLLCETCYAMGRVAEAVEHRAASKEASDGTR